MKNLGCLPLSQSPRIFVIFFFRGESFRNRLILVKRLHILAAGLQLNNWIRSDLMRNKLIISQEVREVTLEIWKKFIQQMRG